MITPGKLLIYKKVYGEWQGCMPCTHQHLREHFALPGRPVPIDNSTGRLGVTGGLRRCQVIPTGWLWFSGTKTNSAAVIQYRFPDDLSAAKVFFRTRLISCRERYTTGERDNLTSLNYTPPLLPLYCRSAQRRQHIHVHSIYSVYFLFAYLYIVYSLKYNTYFISLSHTAALPL